jgi:hypothetical protein
MHFLRPRGFFAPRPFGPSAEPRDLTYDQELFVTALSLHITYMLGYSAPPYELRAWVRDCWPLIERVPSLDEWGQRWLELPLPPELVDVHTPAAGAEAPEPVWPTGAEAPEPVWPVWSAGAEATELVWLAGEEAPEPFWPARLCIWLSGEEAPPPVWPVWPA